MAKEKLSYASLLFEFFNRPNNIGEMNYRFMNEFISQRLGLELIKAIKSDKIIEYIENLIEEQADVNVKDKEGLTALFIACQQDNPNFELIKLLIAKGADVNAACEVTILSDWEDTCFQTPLDRACNQINPNLELIKLLIENGANVNVEGSDNEAPIHYALKMNCFESVAILIENGASFGSSKEEFKKIYHLLKMNHFQGISAEKICAIVAKAKAEEILKDISTLVYEYLHQQNPNFEIVKLLIENKVDVNVKNEDDLTLLHFSCCGIKSNFDFTKFLIDKGADVNEQYLGGWTVLHRICNGNQNPEIVQLLIKNGADVNARNEKGLTALSISCKQKNPNLESIKLLMENGADINLKDSEGRAPINYACQHNHAQVVAILIENGASFDGSCQEFRKIYTCLKNNYFQGMSIKKVYEILAEAKEIDVQDIPGLILQYLKQENPNLELIESLIGNKANINSQDLKKEVPKLYNIFKQAKEQKEIPIIKYLIKETKYQKTIFEVIRENGEEEENVSFFQKEAIPFKFKSVVKYKSAQQSELIVCSQEVRDEVTNNQYNPPNIEEESKTYTKDGQIYSCANNKVLTCNFGNHIYILDKNGHLYVHDYNDDKIKHSYFLKGKIGDELYGYGKPVACAGKMSVSDGKITYIDNDSGHYMPNLDQLKLAVKHLHAQDTLSNGVIIKEVTSHSYHWLTDVLNTELIDDTPQLFADHFYEDNHTTCMLGGYFEIND